MTGRVNHPLRIYTAGIGLICAGSVVFALEARQEAAHARSTADARVAVERSRTEEALRLAATAATFSKKVQTQDAALVGRYNALVAAKKHSDVVYARELHKAQVAANNGVPVTYVGGGTTYSYASAKTTTPNATRTTTSTPVTKTS